MKYRRIIFWQETPSPHQAPWIRALAQEVQGCEVFCVFQKGLSQDRRALGMQPPDYGKVPVIISPDPSTIKSLLAGDTERTVHIFSGTVHNSSINSAFSEACSTKAVIGILSEGRDWRGLKGALRKAHSFLHERKTRSRVEFVLAIGRMGTSWFQKCNYDLPKLFPFCYVVETLEEDKRYVLETKSFVITCVGRLIPLKRIDLLLDALPNVLISEWNLKIFGDGQQKPLLESKASQLGLTNRTSFRGALDNRQVRREVAQSDLFVFPSRGDGWGAVVNEALMSGVPVICSDFCGAADLIHEGFNGDLFVCDSMRSLVNVLDKWIIKGRLSEAHRNRIREWSRCIEAPSVAHYFLNILQYLENYDGFRPNAPWKQSLIRHFE